MIPVLPQTCMSDTYEEIYKPSKLAEFLCNVNEITWIYQSKKGTSYYMASGTQRYNIKMFVAILTAGMPNKT